MSAAWPPSERSGPFDPEDPHRAQPVRTVGAPLASARAAVILLHGRGADAADILGLSRAVAVPHVAWLAPDAASHHWYPDRFMAPIAHNEPWLSSALRLVDRVVADVVGAGIPHERLVLAGFSQGACLALEYAARHARRYGGVAALAGGVIGPEGTARNYAGAFADTPVFIGVGDRDAHIPETRARESAALFAAMGATVDCRVYPGVGHTVLDDELEAMKGIVASAATVASA